MSTIKSSRDLLKIPQYPSENIVFCEGDTVRSYRSAFDSIFPYKNHFIQGVVIATKDKLLGDGYLTVKWQINYFFGSAYPFKMPHDGSDTFAISTRSPHLVKQNKNQLCLPV
jgi:hypothetical protein